MRPTLIARRLLVAVGVVSLCAGLVVSFGPPVEGVFRWPWADDTLLVAFFTVAFTLACLVVPSVLPNDGDRAESTPDVPERVPPTPAPGREFERVLDDRWPASLPPARRRRIRTEFRRAAIRTILRTSDCTAETARERLERGTWTDDPAAAAFVRTDSESDPSRLRSIVDRLRFTRRARRTVRALLTLAEGGDRR